MALAMSQRGNDVTLLSTVAASTSTGPFGALADLVETQVRLVGFPRSARLPYDASLPLLAWLRANASQYDLIEVHGVFDFPALAAASLAKRMGVPFLVHPHGSLDPFDLRKHRTLKTALGRSWLRHVLAASESIVVATPKEGERLETFGAVVHAESLPHPYLCATTHGDGDAFRQRVGAGNRRVVLFLGRVDYKKGLSYLIDAADRLSKEEIHFVIAGDASSKYAQRLMRTVDLRGLTTVNFVGHLDNAAKADALAGSDILALVSDNENYGLVLVEAAHFGVPMLVSSEVYLSDELELLGAARIVGRNGDSVATALREILGQDKLIRQMRSAARRAAGSIFDWERAGSAHERFRQHLLKRGLGP
jgi:glycosyltransferase involved in cell wall biosynthesis